MRALLLAAAASVLTSSCTHAPQLKPGPSAARAPGNPNAGFADVAGVRVLVAGDAWQGDPGNLADVFTPVHIAVENGSGKSVRISYADFALTSASGFRYAAIPPLAARGVVSQFAPSPRFYADGFFIAEHYGPYYPRYPRWVYPFPYDPWYFDRYYSWPEPLPTPDMLAHALPEGVIQDRGRVAGFLYFQSVVQREPQVAFEMNVVEAPGGQALGRVSIPFVVQR